MRPTAAEETGRSVEEIKKRWLEAANYDPAIFEKDGDDEDYYEHPKN